MERLHAPWRISYILAPKPPAGDSDTSIFTRIAQSSEDVDNYVIARDRTCYALLNTYPYGAGHLLIVPYRQVKDLDGLTDDEMTDLFKLVRRCQNALSSVMNPQGFNIGMNIGRVAGAGIAEHLHVHIVPRWTGDTNFMPVISDTAILPEALSELAAKLRKALQL